MPNIKVFSGSSNPDLALKIVERLGSYSFFSYYKNNKFICIYYRFECLILTFFY
jgi:hypothetical protein